MTTTTSSLPIAPTGDRWLRAALLVDGAVTGVNGLAYVLAATLLTTFLGPSVPFLVGIGVFLVSCSIVFLLVGRARTPPPAGVWFAVTANAAWALASVLYVITTDALTTVGQVWAVLQAIIVLGFSVAQLIGLRRARA